jgi:hypothetical protein
MVQDADIGKSHARLWINRLIVEFAACLRIAAFVTADINLIIVWSLVFCADRQ